MYKSVIVGIFLIFFSSCSGVAESTEKAELVVERLHKDYNLERFDRIYKTSASDYKKVVKPEMNRRLFKTIRRKLGKVKEAKRVGWNVNATTGGTFVTLNYETEFELDKGVETFTIVVSDGKAAMLNFNVNSPALMVELDE
ncbi:hypothetical protein [Parasphingorhabdus sp.]|uniref:hypothetical protein n=1 Tax=Parasphingorhabdus sp. TaxID=2709688 RepID=UPI003267FC4E